MRFQKIALFSAAILCLTIFDQVFSQDVGVKRRRIRKKLVDTSESSPVNSTEPKLVEVNIQQDKETDVSSTDAGTTERLGRGFLDDYYSKFEDRVETSHVDNLRSNERMDTAAGYPSVGVALTGIDDNVRTVEDVSRLDAEHRSVTQGNFRNYPDITSFLMPSSKKKSLMETKATSQLLPEYAGEGRYMQQVVLPKHKPGDNAYMFSALPVDIPSENDISATVKAKRKTLTSGLTPPSEKYEMAGLESLLTGSPVEKTYLGSASSFDSPSYEYNDASDTRDPMSKFFGITGTTSQDIQLGLTFTVPFLSIPLTSINSIFNGNGLGDIMDTFSSSSLVTVGILAVLVIFVLPQVIYWLTGVNLSAFSWGRDDDHGIELTSLARTVDEALLKYDIDTKTCLARTMCKQYQSRSSDSETLGRVNRGLVENIAESNFVKKYLGESRVSEALRQGSSGKDCLEFYAKDVCPWDTSAMIKIVSKILSSGQNIDFASIATAAAAASSMAAASSGKK